MRRIQSGGRFPHHVGAIGVGFCFLQCDSILGNFARSLHLSSVCLSLCVSCPSHAPHFDSFGVSCGGLSRDNSVMGGMALEGTSGEGLQAWTSRLGERWRDVVWFGFQEAPPRGC